jgi:hypothetical protein
MTDKGKDLLIGSVGALLLCAGAPAHAQNTAAPASAPPPTVSQSPLQDFRLPGRTVVPQQQQPQPVVVAPPSPVTTAPPAARPQATAPARPAPQRETPAPTPTQAAPAQEAAPPPSAPSLPLDTAPLPARVAPAGAPQSTIPWLYVAPAAAALALLAFMLIRRRRRRADEEEAYEAPAIEAPAAPAPQPRPWLELELRAERVSATDAETVVNFDLEIVNNGEAPAHNLRIDVKMFNAGAEQDKEIGAFFRTAGRDSTKCSLPGIAPGTTGAIKGSVRLRRDEMKAVKLEDRYLFIPMIAVNALYDYGDGQTGQTSKSYVVGRELEAPSEKMGAFRVDLGPRIWRTVGQRQHKLARRV